MSEHKEDKINISDEQLDLLATSFFPVIRDFYKSDRGKKFWEEHLKKIENEVDTAAV
ncbi:MAG: hypothetical protein K2H23_01600 [Oscillospiraceae bacterium]|nr:hypothetical protein [Oscillospiraceae bacterium]